MKYLRARFVSPCYPSLENFRNSKVSKQFTVNDGMGTVLTIYRFNGMTIGVVKSKTNFMIVLEARAKTKIQFYGKTIDPKVTARKGF